MKNKKCPLRKVQTSHTVNGQNPPYHTTINSVFQDCIKDECAWYDEELKKCIIAVKDKGKILI